MQLNPSAVPVPCVLPAMEGPGGAEPGAAGQGTEGPWVPDRRDGSASRRRVWCGQCCAFSTDLELSFNCLNQVR